MLTCRRCHQYIDETDCYCRYCGKALEPRKGFWFDHWGILLLTLCVGPLSLICVWLSRKISLTAKWIWTALLLLFSFYIVYAIYKTILLLFSLLWAIIPA